MIREKLVRDIKHKNIMLVFLLTITFVELIRTAWISDDAAITLRTVLNFINGYGATFNIDERVQAYTHPLWFLLISGLSIFTQNVFTATYLLSIVISVAVLWMLLAHITTNLWGGVIGACILIFSKAYVDFSTSGLENPLSHLLILLGIFFSLKAIEQPSFSVLTTFFLSCSLLYLNRPDAIILIFPLSLLVMFKNRLTPSILAKAITIGMLPALVWTLFAIYYYGFPFPNTAYAKLGTEIPMDERIIQGGKYLLDSARHDPLTLTMIFIGITVGLRSPFGFALATGTILHLVYVVGIGGDFMSGRFFTAPLLTAAVLIARSNISKRLLRYITVGVGLLGMMTIKATLLSDASYINKKIDDNGIADERGFYFQDFGLINMQDRRFTRPIWIANNRSVTLACGGLGFQGIFQGPGTHLIDECGLTDPLLARLPAKYNPHWRIGHFVRQLPAGYEASIKKNANLLSDPITKKYYESLRKITRGQLNDSQRLREIARINLGQVKKSD